MSFEGFNFIGNCHCPYCKTGLIMIDNKPVSCPVCELQRLKKFHTVEKRHRISQPVM
ncbi:MAG: hypothetical protein ACFFG0_35095 [Candidatus Thorarchaeota archaeon]